MPSPVPGTESASADQAPLMQVEGVHGAAAARERIARLRAGQDAGGPVDFNGLALIGKSGEIIPAFLEAWARVFGRQEP